MPNIKASVKSMKQDAFEKDRIRKAKKKVLAAIAENNYDEAMSLFSLATKAIDQAAANHTIHKNNAARKKSKLAKKINALKA